MSRLRTVRGPALVLALLVSPACALTAPPPDTPGPQLWQSWLSVTGMDRDLRLERAVSLSLPDSDLATLLARMSDHAHVSLECEESLRHRPITVYLPGTRLKDAMAELASFLMCEWIVTDTGGEPAYTLHKTSALLKAEHGAVERWLGRRREPRPPSDEKIATTMQRLREYAAALPLSDDERIARYGDTDPWLAASFLDPVTKVFVPFLTGLSRDQVTAVAGPGLTFRVNELPAGIQAHIRRWGNGDYGDYGPPDRLLDEDEASITRFPTPEQRWAHATLTIGAGYTALFVHLDVPDTLHTHCQPVHFKSDSPGNAFWLIFSHQHPHPTDEESQAYRAKQTRTSKTWGQRQKEEREQQLRARRQALLRQAGADWSDRATLQQKLIPWPYGQESPVTPDRILVHIAEQARMPLLADSTRFGHASPADTVRQEQTVQQALEYASQWGGSSSWSKPLGRFAWVQMSEASRVTLAAAPIPDEVLAEWDRIIEGKTHLTIDEVAAMLSSLTPAQRAIGIHYTKWASLRDSATDALRFLEGGVLQRLLAGDEVRFPELTDRQRQTVLAWARSSRPWLGPGDLKNTTIAILRDQAPPGYRSPGSSFGTIIIRYNLPDAPTDCDFGVLPLSLRIRDLLPEPDSDQPSPETPAPAEPTDADLSDTGWLYRGTLTFGDVRQAIVTNTSTGEMELVPEGGAFRSFTISQIAETSLLLLDAEQNTHTMPLRMPGPSEPGLPPPIPSPEPLPD